MMEDDINMVAVSGIVATGDTMHRQTLRQRGREVLLGERSNRKKERIEVERRGQRPTMGLDIGEGL